MIPLLNVAKNHVFRTAKGDMDAYPGHVFTSPSPPLVWRTLTCSSTKELEKSQMLRTKYFIKTASPVSLWRKGGKRDIPVSTVNYRPVPDRLDQLAEHESVKNRDKEVFKKNWHEKV